MEKFSSGLLYSVPPEYISQLHLNEDLPFDKDRQGDFVWPTTGCAWLNGMMGRLKCGDGKQPR